MEPITQKSLYVSKTQNKNMKIEVNTKEDSKEEIMHAIKLLMSAAGMQGKEVFSNEISEIEESKEENGMLNLFNDSKTDEPKKDNDGYVNMFAPNEEKEEENEIESTPNMVVEEQAEPANPLANFFGDTQAPVASSSSETSSTVISTEGEDEDDDDYGREEEKDSLNSFFKEYDDEEDEDGKKKKPKIKFY